MMDLIHEFICAYNLELETIGCRVRVAANHSDACSTVMIVYDAECFELGVLPISIDPSEFAAMMLIVDRAYRRGIDEGRRASSIRTSYPS